MLLYLEVPLSENEEEILNAIASKWWMDQTAFDADVFILRIHDYVLWNNIVILC